MEKYKKGISVYVNDTEVDILNKARKDIFLKEDKVVSYSEVLRRAIYLLDKKQDVKPDAKQESEQVSKPDNEQSGNLWDSLDI